MLEAIILVVFPFCMLFAALSDMLSMTIANRLSAILVATFVVVAPFTGMDWPVFGSHLLAGALVLTITFGLFALGGMGGGDAKLIAASSVWMGLGYNLLAYLLVASFLGGILTFLILLFRGSPLALYSSRNVFLKNFGADAKGVPYGIALGVAGLMVYPESPLMTWAIDRLVAG